MNVHRQRQPENAKENVKELQLKQNLFYWELDGSLDRTFLNYKNKE